MSEDKKPHTIENSDGTKTVELGTAITIAGEQVASVTFRKPFGRDLRSMDQEKGEIGKSFRLASSISKLPMGAFDAMTIDDAMACVQAADSWSSKS